MKFRTAFFATILSLYGVSASAAVYECDIDSKSHNWLPVKLFVSHKAGSNTATVSDPIIHHFYGKPIGVRVKHDNERRVTFGWTVKAVNKSRQRANMVYRATYLKSSGKLSINAQPNGYSNKFSASGTCKVS
ncbi:MAG: hypothetical protein GKR99_06320 [Rhodobacteraceae bacterium]|nr:hypothetical protein [Paracoccaceae bacterium]